MWCFLSSNKTDRHVFLLCIVTVAITIIIVIISGGSLILPDIGLSAAQCHHRFDTGAGVQVAPTVNGGEVMNLCTDPRADDPVDPVADYRDNATASTYGAPNQCRWLDDLGALVTFDQDLAPLRATAGVRGDVNCDGRVDVIDALQIAQFTVGVRTDAGVCPLPDPANQVNIGHGDFDVADGATIIDALHIARCTVGIDNRGYCAD